MVKLDPLTSENKLKGEIRAVTRPQFDDRRSFGTLAFQNGFEYCNLDFAG